MFLNAHKTVSFKIFKKSFFNFVVNLKINKMEKIYYMLFCTLFELFELFSVNF